MLNLKRTRIFSCICLLLAVVMIFAGCSKAKDNAETTAQPAEGKVVATVGDTPIYDYELKFYCMNYGMTADEMLNMLAENNRVVNYATENGYTVPEEKIAEAEAMLDSEKEQYKTEYDAFLERVGITEEQYRSVVLKSLSYENAYNSLIDMNVLEGFGTEELKAYYDDNFLRAKHVLIAFTDSEGNAVEEADALKEAQDVKKRLDDGESIDDLMSLSDDPGSATSPDGYVFINTDGMDDMVKQSLSGSGLVMVDEFTKGTVDLEIGAVSEPIKTNYGYHVIQRLDINETEKFFEDNKSKVMSAMTMEQQEAYTAANDAFMKTLEEKYTLETKEDALSVVRTEVDAKLAEMMAAQSDVPTEPVVEPDAEAEAEAE